MAIDFTYIIESAQNASEAISTTVDAFNNSANVAMEALNSIQNTQDAVLLAANSEGADNMKKMGAFIGAGLAMVGASGVGAGQGYAAGAAALAVARNPEMKSQIMSTAIIGMAIAESAAIYALIIAILLIFVAS